MKAKRREIQNVRCYKIGSDKKKPHWLRAAIAKGEVTFYNSNAITDIAVISWNDSKKYFYDGDYVVKLPEGPVIGVTAEKFKQLYAWQPPTKEYVEYLEWMANYARSHAKN